MSVCARVCFAESQFCGTVVAAVPDVGLGFHVFFCVLCVCDCPVCVGQWTVAACITPTAPL